MNKTLKLNNVKVVLGNGFDLYCGLRTSYKNYFDFKQKDYAILHKFFAGTMLNVVQGRSSFATYRNVAKDCFKNHPELKKFNCFDLFFLLAEIDGFDGGNWCDVERQLLNSLRDKDDSKDLSVASAHWENVFDYLASPSNLKSRVKLTAGSKTLALFITAKRHALKQTWQNLFLLHESKGEFYEYLLGELKEFEMDFAVFITKQHVANNNSTGIINIDYIDHVTQFFELISNDNFGIIGKNSITSIDCFNYGFSPSHIAKCLFVNGNCLSPIFGVDSIFSPGVPEYIFTKTNRRIEMGMYRGDGRLCSIQGDDAKDDFDNVLVFGHSLDKADYNYFFPILDQLEICDYSSKKKFVVAYCVYDDKKDFEIKKYLREHIYSLFTAYAQYKGRMGDEANRLLDTLTTQRRVLTIELPKLKPYRPFIYEQMALDDWDSCGGSLRAKIAKRWSWYTLMVSKYGTNYAEFSGDEAELS